MGTAVLTITLITLVASLASWLFGQWLARRIGVTSTALVIGGSGVVLLLGAAVFVMIGATTGWQRLFPFQDLSSEAGAATAKLRQKAADSAARPDPFSRLDQYYVDPQRAVQPQQSVGAVELPAAVFDEPSKERVVKPSAKPVPRAIFGGPKDELLAAAEGHLTSGEYAQAIDVARDYLALQPNDSEMRSMLARALFAAEHPGSAGYIPAVVVAEWPATDCVGSVRSDESARWILDNGCGRVIAVLFASCQLSETACFTNAIVSQGGWTYEPAGILMTAGNDKPVPLRLGREGPPVAPVFTIRDPADAQRQIRYLACEVKAPGVLQALHTSGIDEQRLALELRADECYSQVLAWTRSGHRQGKSPDALLREGID